MAQLKMYCFPGTPVPEIKLPEGYSISNYKTEEDKLAWCECCRKGLIGDEEGAEAFDNAILSREDLNPYEDVFFIDYNGEHVGTVTAFVDKEDNTGDMHMVGIRPDFRGKGLAKILNAITLKHLFAKNVKYVFLTTDDWRKPAVKSYLSGGFLPVKYDVGMVKRWRDMLEVLGIDSVEMVKNNGKPYKTIYRKGFTKQD